MLWPFVYHTRVELTYAVESIADPHAAHFHLSNGVQQRVEAVGEAVLTMIEAGDALQTAIAEAPSAFSARRNYAIEPNATTALKNLVH